MDTILTPQPPQPLPPEPVPPLRNGDRLTRGEFERRYAAMPGLKKAELVEGIVYLMPSPVSELHGGPHFDLITVLGAFRAATPGVVGGDNTTLRLDLDNEPQPDAFLRILETLGGQSRRNANGYVEGAPELAAEVATSSANYDMHAKLNVYRRNGVREYLVWRTEDVAFDWFILRGEKYENLPDAPDGILKSEAFPGLWLDAPALLRGEMARVMKASQAGLASPEHGAFVESLRRQSGGPARPGV